MDADTTKSDKLKRIMILINKGNEYFERQDYRLALTTFDTVLNEEPRFFDALIGKMKVYRELFQWQNVILCCDKILEINPKEIIAIEHKIWSLYALKDYKAALDIAEKSIQEYPNNASIQRCLNECKARIKDIKKISPDKEEFKKKTKEIKHGKKLEDLKKIVIPQKVESEAGILPDLSEMKKTNTFLYTTVYAYLMVIIIIFLIISLFYFDNLSINTSLLVEIGLYACLLGSFLLLVLLDPHTNSQELGISTQNMLTSLFIGIFVSSGFVITALLFWVGPITTNTVTILELAILTALIGITEELYFRGYIESKLRKTTSTFRAILFTGLFFAFLHIPKLFIAPIITQDISYFVSIPSAVQSLVVLGFLFGFIRENTKNIIGPIVAHATWDFYLLIYTPMNYTQLYSISNIRYFSIFEMVASYAMIGTFLLAWAISNAMKVYRLEDPRELVTNIEELLNSAKRYEKKARKMEYKVKILSIRQSSYKGYPFYKGLELKRRKLKCKIDFYNEKKELYQKLAEELNLENYADLMYEKKEEESRTKNVLSQNIINAVRSPVTQRDFQIKMPRYNNFGYDLSGINSKMSRLQRQKIELQTKLELYSMKQDLIRDKGPKVNREILYLELKKEKIRIQIEYYDRLIGFYSEIAESVNENNQKQKREFLREQIEYAKSELQQKMRQIQYPYSKQKYNRA